MEVAKIRRYVIDRCGRVFEALAIAVVIIAHLSINAGAAEPRREASSSAVHYGSATVGSIRIFYREAGNPQSPSILVLHGFSSLLAGAEAYRHDALDITVKYFDTGHFALEEDAEGIALAIDQSFARGQR